MKTGDHQGGAPRALLTSESTEWYTPSKYIEAARDVMGSIDLDPASCQRANETVQADHCYYDKADDGLFQEWHGNVWLNPPYGRCPNTHKSSQGIWARAVVDRYRAGEIDQAVVLVNASTDCRWFIPLWDYPICFPRGRIKFNSPRGDKPKSPTHGSALVYLGPNTGRFAEVFKQFGPVVLDVAGAG